MVLTIIDRFSKYAHFIPLGHPYTASSVAKAFFDNIVRLHGVHSSMVSDQDPAFTSSFWTELFCLTSVKLRLSSTFHLQSNGQMEVVNPVLGMYLQCLSCDRPKDWLSLLPWTEFCYNSFQTTLRATPFRMVYGRDPPTLLTYEQGTAKVCAVDQQLLDRDEFWADIKERLLQAQSVMKERYDDLHRDLEFHLGDWVWFHLQHKQAASLAVSSNTKLSPRFFGPYKVMERIGAVAYCWSFPPMPASITSSTSPPWTSAMATLQPHLFLCRTSSVSVSFQHQRRSNTLI